MPAVRAAGFLRQWAQRLTAAGIDTGRLDAELLLAHTLGTDRNRLFLDDPELSAGQQATAEALLTRRELERVPVAYLVGERWFDGLALHVSGAVLVPRPETELLVEFAAALAPPSATVIDVGTGSGAIAIALAVRRPDLAITASDIDDGALAVARANAERLVSGPIAFQHASLLGDWRGEVVVSNPPYVEDSWREQATPELAHEPPHALYAGADGTDVINDLVRECEQSHVGLILIEHGHQQGPAVRRLLDRAGYRASTEHDLAGHDRLTWALRRDLWPPRGADLDELRRRWS